MYVMPEKEKVALKRINGFDSFRAVEFMKYMGKKELVCQVCGFLKFGIFVIPNETRWECDNCHSCCTSSHSPNFLPPELPKDKEGNCTNCVDGKCIIQDTKTPACKIYPFTFVRDSKSHPDSMVIIDPRCRGFGKGKVVTDDIYSKLQSILLVYGQVNEAFE